MVVGGPFGIERYLSVFSSHYFIAFNLHLSTVGIAGPFVTIIGLFLVIFAWLLPQALISIELSLMMDKSGTDIRITLLLAFP